MSHAGHKIVKCRDCDAVLTQCRCISPNKLVEYRDGPCPLCLKKADREGDQLTPFLRMTKQPKWPNRNAPDRIRIEHGGFTDGSGTAFRPPPGITEAVNINGVWHWKR